MTLRSTTPSPSARLAESASTRTSPTSATSARRRRVRPSAELADAVADADVVIEAAPEKLALKQEIFGELERLAPRGALLASNTSVIPIGKIAARVTTRDRVLGTHWWNPPYLVPLVEVIQTDGRPPRRRRDDRFAALGRQDAVHVRKDVPGFVGNRLHALGARRPPGRRAPIAETVDRW